jgi:hypothetical protein
MVVIIKSMTNAGFFEPKDHKGKGYYVKIPAGWKKAKPQKDVYYPKDVGVVMFVPHGMDTDKGQPAIFVSIYTKKLSTPIWIEDEFPDILNSIQKSGMAIKDKGQIKIDDLITHWVVYFDKAAPALVMEFYMVTDNNTFHKIQYSASPEQFNKYRKSFEELKDSFKFRFSLY